MILFKRAESLHKYIEQQKENKLSVGFVPTMGALHAGHISLVELCKLETDITICSIFVNPTQFNNQSDFENYPTTLSDDIRTLEHAKCDVLFLPSVNEMYPQGTAATKTYELGQLENILEGYYRPGHFQGVCQVVERLLRIVNPHKVYFGQKDYQQVLVIKKLVQTLQLPVEIITSDTLREASGLAMSSRNMRLTSEQKDNAASIYKMLMYIKDNYTTSPLPALEKYATEYLLEHNFDKVDYVSIMDANDLSPVMQWDGNRSLVVLIAAFIGPVRLIDNMIITEHNN